MKGYIAKRIIFGFLSAVCTVVLVMGVLYGVLDRNLIFASDAVYNKLSSNQKTVYKYQMWEEYGYLDMISYSDYLSGLVDSGELTAEEKKQIAVIGDRESDDSEATREYVRGFADYCGDEGYEMVRLPACTDAEGNYAAGGEPYLFAYRDYSIAVTLLHYFSNLIEIDSINSVKEDVGERGITFTAYDPVYGGDTFSPAVMGNGTKHKYLLYFDSSFPFLHENLITVNLGKSYSVNRGIDVLETMTSSQGEPVYRETTYPTGYVETSSDNLHSAQYAESSLESMAFYKKRYDDNYTSVTTYKSGLSKIGFSFFIGILAVIFSYAVALPVSTWMAMRRGGISDILGTAYIAFMTAVPALAYIFLFKAIGNAVGLPITFDMKGITAAMYVLPVISIALPATSNLMKWNRRFARDQMSSDYVLFAKACGYGKKDILLKHVMRNAAIPITHGIPWSILGAITGAIITERVYSVPGTGNLLTTAINAYDNSVIVGLTFFYALLSVASVLLGDLLMAAMDPRISLKGRKGARHGES